MTNRQVLTTAILVIAISMSIAGSQDVFADHRDRYQPPEITNVVPTIDGAFVEWTQEQRRGFDPKDFEITSDSFNEEVDGDVRSITITGLECGTEYEVEVEADWRGHGKLRDTESYETLACEPEEPEPEGEGCSRHYEDPVITSITPTIDGAVVTWTQEQKKVIFHCFDPREFKVTSGSFIEDHIEGDTSGTATITGLSCGTNYDVEVATDWIFHSDTTDSDSYTTLACEEEDERGGGGDDRHKTAPTSGNDWNTFENLVEGGITVDRVSFTLTDNWWTPFEQIQIETGSTHTFSVTTFAQNGGLMVQEIAFGIPEVGYYQDAEALVEVHYDWDKTILELVVVQDTEVLDVLSVSTDQVLCRDESDAICYQTNLTIKFNEPLKDKVYAVKAFDMTRRTMMPHYFNDGINVFGDSTNPMITMQIASTEKFEGLIEITQVEKYSSLWVSEDGRIFDADNYFSQTNKEIQQGYNDARGSIIMQQRADGQAYLASQLYFDSSLIQGTDKGFIAPALDLDGDHRDQTLQSLDWYNTN
jgi:hypothetical protein